MVSTASGDMCSERGQIIEMQHNVTKESQGSLECVDAFS